MGRVGCWLLTGIEIIFLTACSTYTAAPNTQAIVKLPAFELRLFKGKARRCNGKRHPGRCCRFCET